MKFYKLIIINIGISIIMFGCKSKYTFNNVNIGNATTFQVNSFKNNSNLIEPGLNRDFTLSLQELLLNQTSLSLVKTGGDLVYQGEITDYKISPTTATSQNTAAQNRLKISINVLHFNKLKKDSNFEQTFSFFYDYPSDKQLTGNLKNEAIEAIFKHITQDIFNTTLTAKW
ncbi:LPS assembly lipoprotein LptE [Flavivirga algicola]|uniref:LptE family protein n=1 Tax=Flavivirga algicola TaxID=2729136 RepID=A0ABX1S429_9FLAO|nr:LptE family protein [Flavivirga algicola]NMH89803.1 LptE family protein [Flavivirga algicola]